jgi:hypothetical protein
MLGGHEGLRASTHRPRRRLPPMPRRRSELPELRACLCSPRRSELPAHRGAAGRAGRARAPAASLPRRSAPDPPPLAPGRWIRRCERHCERRCERRCSMDLPPKRSRASRRRQLAHPLVQRHRAAERARIRPRSPDEGRNQTQSDAIRRNQTQSDAIRRNQGLSRIRPRSPRCTWRAAPCRHPGV